MNEPYQPPPGLDLGGSFAELYGGARPWEPPDLPRPDPSKPPWMRQEELAEKADEDRLTQPSWEPDPDAMEKQRLDDLQRDNPPEEPEMERDEMGRLVYKKREKKEEKGGE